MVEQKIIDEIQKVCFEKQTFDGSIDSYNDLEALRIKLVSTIDNPYKSLVEMSLMTWGNEGEKWNKLSPQSRLYAVKEVLENRALPLAKESIKFNFYIDGVTRHCFDQIARARIGVVFSSMGTKDNNVSGSKFIVPYIFNETDKQKVEEQYRSSIELYNELRSTYPGWAARYVLPEGVMHHFFMSIDYSSLQGFCSNRMETTEQTDTVAVAWKLREVVKSKFPLLANYLRPACDFVKRDRTVAVNGFADILGIPHSSDNRWNSDADKKYRIWWNYPCTDIKYLIKQGVEVVQSNEWIDYSWDNLSESDKKLLSEE